MESNGARVCKHVVCKTGFSAVAELNLVKLEILCFKIEQTHILSSPHIVESIFCNMRCYSNHFWCECSLRKAVTATCINWEKDIINAM